MDSVEYSLFENLERTQRSLKKKLELDYLGPRWMSSMVDLCNHLETQLQELRHYTEVISLKENDSLKSW